MTTATLNAIDSVFRSLVRELWIVTAADGNRRGGLLATWVSPASIDREHPVVLAGIAPNHFTAELIDASQAFAAHLLTVAEIDLAWNFALGSGRDRDKLADVSHVTSDLGNPILNRSLAWLDCRVFHRVVTGDRIFYWADVVSAGQKKDGAALTDRELFMAATDDQRRQLLAGRDADIAIQRPLSQAWRESLFN